MIARALPVLGFILICGSALRLSEFATAQQLSEEASSPSLSSSAEVLAALRAREERLLAREIAINERESSLEIIEARTKEMSLALNSASEDLSNVIALAATVAQQDVNSLTQIYQDMKPAQAALVFNEMTPEFAAGFLAEMRPDVAAVIMSAMKVEQVYAVTAVIAGRNLNVPTQ